MLSTLIQAVAITQIPDVRDQPLGERTADRASALAVATIRDRIVREHGGVPVAAFQSSI